jgi:hypothetical protein
MNDRHQPTRWWGLYASVGLMVGLYVAEARLPLSPISHKVAEVGLVLLGYGLVVRWLNGNRMALLREPRPPSLRDPLRDDLPQAPRRGGSQADPSESDDDIRLYGGISRKALVRAAPAQPSANGRRPGLAVARLARHSGMERKN